MKFNNYCSAPVGHPGCWTWTEESKRGEDTRRQVIARRELENVQESTNLALFLLSAPERACSCILRYNQGGRRYCRHREPMKVEDDVKWHGDEIREQYRLRSQRHSGS